MVLRTIDENHRLIDIVGAEGLVLLRIVESTTDADIVTALQDTLEGIGTTGTILTNEAVRSFGDTAHAMRPADLSDLTILDIKLTGGTGGLPRDDERRVLAMRIDDEVLRLLDSRRVDLEIIDSNTGQTQGVLLVAIDPDEDKSKVLGRVSGIDTHYIGKRHILPRLATANEFLAGLAECLTSTYLRIGQTTTRSIDEGIDTVVSGSLYILLTGNHDVQFGGSRVAHTFPIKADFVFLGIGSGRELIEEIRDHHIRRAAEVRVLTVRGDVERTFAFAMHRRTDHPEILRGPIAVVEGPCR